VARISVSYILLCGQVILLLTVLLLQCLEGIHQTHPERATAAFSEHYTELYEYRPPSPVVFCSHRLEEFIPCQDPVDHAQNSTAILEMGHGCWKVCQTLVDSAGTQRCESHTSHLHDIECAGTREFLRGNEQYTLATFITILLYSFFLGCFGVDRFCLGHTGTAMGMLLNLGGLGIWWLVDLITGGLMPSDSSNWCTFY
uniref:TM2 domain-containing protein 2 n=1 Tax=Oncorhynchus kisutch TaxID=8019 RepID=A0A8C7FQJ8_ONCKI